MTRCQTHSQMRLSLGKKVDDKAGTWRRCRGNRGSKKTVLLMISIKSTNPKNHDLTPPKKSPQKKGEGERKPWKNVWKGETVKDWLKWWKKMKMIQKMGDACGSFSEEACRLPGWKDALKLDAFMHWVKSRLDPGAGGGVPPTDTKDLFV